MSSFISRSAILAFARLMTQALALVGPVVLVRLLTVQEYGRYRQFTVTAMFIAALAGFAITANLNYLIARSPEHSAINLTNACLLLLATAVIGALAVVAGHGLIVPAEIIEAWPLLALYVLLSQNLEVLVSYWLAHGRSDRVMQYTLCVTALRLAAVALAAWLFGDVMLIFVTMVCVEALRALAIYIWLRRQGLLVFSWNRSAFSEQLRLLAPLGASSLLNRLNDQIGKVVVSNRMGAEPLAIYTTAAYQVPIVGIVQQTLADVVFPDMVRRSRQDPLQGLKLWQRANVLTFTAIFPSWLLLTYFAEPLIRLLFTDAYVGATAYFQLFLLLMLRQSFQFSTPLRSVEDNASFARANVAALVLNVAFIVALMPRYGLWGPALGLTLGQMWMPFYLGRKVMQRYKIPLSQLCEWRRLGLATLAALLALGALHASQLIWHFNGAMIAGMCIFGLVYLACARLFLREEYGYVMREFSRRGKARHARA